MSAHDWKAEYDAAESDFIRLEERVTDLASRLEQAATRLTDMADATRGQQAARLRGKAEGVRLALSYVREVR
jgi:hypothetical protein